MYFFFVGDLAVPSGVGGTKERYDFGFGRESMFGSLLVSSMEHVKGMLRLGRRGGELGDQGSDLGFLFVRVGELNVPRRITSAEFCFVPAVDGSIFRFVTVMMGF